MTRSLVKRGVQPDRITTVFYGDTRPDGQYKGHDEASLAKNRRVEFLIRKVDLRSKGHGVDSR